MGFDLQTSGAPELSTGQKISVGIALYMVIKPLFNFFILGGSIRPLLLGIVAVVVFYMGVKASNLVIAIILMVVACVNMPTNLKNIGFNSFLIYAIEGVLDMLCAVVLAFHSEVRRHCKMLS